MVQSSSPRCYPPCFPVCFRDELYCCHRKWMLDYRHGSLGSRRSCRKKKGSRKMLLNPKGLYCRTHDQVNKKQFLSPLPSLSLSGFPPCHLHASSRPEESLHVPICLQSTRAWTLGRTACKITAWKSWLNALIPGSVPVPWSLALGYLPSLQAIGLAQL